MRNVVHEDAAGQRLDAYLAHLPGVGSRARAERLVSRGSVKVNGASPAKSRRLKSGDVVEIADTALDEKPMVPATVDTDLPILFEDEHLIIIDKPAGLVVHPGPGVREATLIDLLAQGGVDLADAPDQDVHRPGVIHRIDKGTSGALAVAKTGEALRQMQQLVRDRDVRREYTALVTGTPDSRAGRIESPIGRDRQDPTRQSIDTDKPRDAVTHFIVEELLPTTAMLRLRLETGRTHQIRVHLQAIGLPVVGDVTYGNHNETFGLDRQFLHAAHLAFTHPITGEQVDVTSPLPEDLHTALRAARSMQ